MRISDLISLGARYLALGLLCGALVSAALFIIYRVFLRKKDIPVKKLLLWAVFICYITVVLGVTLMNRQGFWGDMKIMPLLYSYREAWVDFSNVAWRNIILNILMFVPFGFLLPAIWEKFDSLWKISFAAFVFTASIEAVQFFLKLGIFELDDLMNNTVGAMIGYGIFAVFACFIGRKRPLRQVIALQIPLIATISAFAIIFTAYACKPVGNVEGQYVIKYNPERLNVSGGEYSTEAGTLPVYKAPVLSVAETEKLAADFFTAIGTQLDPTQNDIYDGVAVYKAVERYSIWIDYLGGSYNFTDFDTSFPQNELKPKENADENEIKAALSLYGITISDDAEFDSKGGGSYTFKAYNGSLTCKYYENGCFANIRNSLIDLEKHSEMAVISENQAFDMIKQGKFRYYGSENLNIEAGECRLNYVVDSKGFYQPVYDFDCTVNGQPYTITIAAVK